MSATAAFIRQARDGIWRLEPSAPVHVDQPEDAIIDALYADATVVECNEAFTRSRGADRSEYMVGRRLNDILVRDDPTNDALLRAFIRSGFRLTGAESREEGVDGRPRVFVNDLTGVVEEGQLVRVWGTRRDVTVARRTEAELRRAKDVAEAASRAKSAFLASVSHEIRTPLNGVLGMAHLVLQDELSPVQHERMRVLHTSAESLLHVINDLLDFSKMEAGKFELSPGAISPRRRSRRDDEMAGAAAHEKGLQLSFYQEPIVPAVVVGDAGRLRQVLVNLVGNAIKFTERGEVAVRVGFQIADCRLQIEKSKSAVCNLQFEITDTGIGIETDKLARIFEPFEQADAATNARFGGTGLGLAITTRLAALMGGSVTAESEPGRGSTFRFTARVETCGVPKARPMLPAKLAEMRVLVVDPHPLGRGLVVQQLTDWGLDVEDVADPAAAVERARAAGRQFDVLFLGGGASVAETLDALQHLRAECVGSRAVVCVPPGVWTHATLAGAADTAFLVKPFKPADLLDALLGVLRLTPPAWLTGRRTEPAPVAAPAPLRVLLAEDNAVNQAVAVGMLQAAGHVVRVADNGREVLAALAAEPFDVVLMDVQMPEMDGFAATAAIRAVEAGSGRHLPIVAITARAMAGDREECLRRGMDDFIAKPIQPWELHQVLGRLRPLPAGPLLAARESPTPAAADQVLDVASFRTRCGGRDDLVCQVARLFLSECPRHLDRLQTAQAARDVAR